jgi:aspartyl-tRNA(Asn)/glutamyl-tRNA(Gln) amidotransferase subunit C
MSLTENDVKKVAYLARLEIAAQDIPFYQNSLSNIFDFIAQMDKANISHVEEPMAHPLELTQVFAADTVAESPQQREQLLKIAKSTRRGLYLVPQFIE